MTISAHDPKDYTYLGLENQGTPLDPDWQARSLVYLIGLVATGEHKIKQPDVAYRILSWLFELEEQVETGTALLQRQNAFFQRHFSAETYAPQTPCMLTLAWCPIGALLERGHQPLILGKQQRLLAAASGVWPPGDNEEAGEISGARTDEDLFWAIFKAVSERAKARKLLVSLIAKPGWALHMAESLSPLNEQEVAKADRVLWFRRSADPQGRSRGA
jgi:hypothetical protein